VPSLNKHSQDLAVGPLSITRQIKLVAKSAAAYLRRQLCEDKRHTLCYSSRMKTYAWNPEKNDQLKEERGISFEEVVLNIQLGNEVDIYEHPNQERYPGQKISVVLIEGYAYLVPFVENEEEFFLKTIIPSRKATKQYSGDSNE
jgi:uncharacterized DUF497 family protein